jgi:hypothetical protein
MAIYLHFFTIANLNIVQQPFVPRGGSPYYNNLWKVPIAYMKVAV